MKILLTAIALAAAVVAADPAAALLFNFAFTEGTPAQAQQGSRAAAALWSKLLHDNATVNPTARLDPLAPGIPGTTRPARQPYPHATLRQALADDIISFDDAMATGSLPRGGDFAMPPDFTSGSPHGAGSAMPHPDNDGDANNTMRITTAQARSAGPRPADRTLAGCPGAHDALIGCDSQFAFGFEAHDGIGGNSRDFVCVAARARRREYAHSGLMNLTADPGDALAISQHDLLALDAIGWDIPPTAQPSNAKIFRKNKNGG